MSNLSDLLPAGAGAKSATFTADGTLATGTTVILQSDGTVKAVGETSTAASKGSATTFDSGDRDLADVRSIAYDSTNNRVVIAYRDSDNSGYGTAVVGTVSGNTISFGTPVVYESADSLFNAPVFDENAGKVVIFYRDQGNSERGTAIVGTVSGTSISFGSPVVFNSTGASNYNSPVYDPDTQKIVNFYNDEVASRYGTAIVGTVSGTSISFGSEVVFETADSEFISATYDTTANKMVVAYRDNANSFYGTAIVGTVSGTSISFGTPTVFATSDSRNISIVYDASADRVVVFFSDSGDSNKGKAVVGTVSGTSISFGSLVTFSTAPFSNQQSGAYFAAGSKVVVSYRADGTLTYQSATVSGTSLTFDGAVTLDISSPNDPSITYDSTEEKIVLCAEQSLNNGQCQVFNPAYSVTNSANFVGITDEAIANAATGSVVVEGGVITNSALIDFYLSAGSESVFESATTNYTNATFDSTNNKVVAFYSDGGNSAYGTAVVGTVSGTTISFGTPVVFNSGNTESPAGAFDSTNGKVLIAYKDSANLGYGTGIVGTVSGTSISFGSASVFESASTDNFSVSFDSSNSKSVIAYRDRGNTDQGTAVVATISGTSVTFGTPVIFNAAVTSFISTIYDPDQSKVVIAYRDEGNSEYGTAIVGTVSGTSISFGSEVVYETASSGYNRMAYDTNADKVVITYRDNGNSFYGTAIVGTVSGTSISFGTAVAFTDYRTDYNSPVYDVASGQIIISYKGTTPTEGLVIAGTVSGTSISFGTAISYNAANTSAQNIVYDSNAQKSVVVYTDVGNSNYGTASVITASQDLTVGSTYYVQNDGSLSTTSSSVTAGKALSSTTLLLKG